AREGQTQEGKSSKGSCRQSGSCN
ncbi:hypothetical protein A2U01_0107112, partial [Trifolium medium]|nr:hypothetical protein [Trifolium medium]